MAVSPVSLPCSGQGAKLLELGGPGGVVTASAGEGQGRCCGEGTNAFHRSQQSRGQPAVAVSAEATSALLGVQGGAVELQAWIPAEQPVFSFEGSDSMVSRGGLS